MMGELVTVSPQIRLQGIFTYGVPSHLWRSGNSGGGDGTVSSVDGALTLTSGSVDSGVTWLQSRPHPRYTSDSPFGFATATDGLPTGGATLRFGQFTEWEGVYLSIDLSTQVVTVYTRRTTGVVAPNPEDHTDGTGVATTTDTLAFTAQIPNGSDISYATLWDLYSQWRGVGNVKALVDLQRVGASERLGAASGLWSSNPALPFRIELERHPGGDDVTCQFGCMRIVSHEVNGSESYDYIDVPSGDVTIDGTERPLLVFQAAGFLAGLPCTRDHLVHKIRMMTADAKTVFRVRRLCTIGATGTTWSIPYPDRGFIKGIGSSTGTVTGGDVLYEEAVVANEKVRDIDLLNAVRPVPGTATTGANRGDPTYGETWAVTAQKSAGGSAVVSCVVRIGSLF